MSGIGVLCEYLIPPVLVFLLFAVTGGVLMAKGRKKAGTGVLVLLVVIVLLIVLVPVPARWMYRDWNDEMDPDSLLIKGTWTTLYNHPSDDTKLIKQISAPGVSHCDFSHVALPTPFRNCSRDSCTLPCLMAHRISTRFMMESLRRVKNMNSKFFPKIYEIDEKKRRYVSEKVPHELTEYTCPLDYEEQMAEFNRELKRKGYYLDDVHSKNWMVDDKGQLKVIDCEVYTRKELALQQWLLNLIDGSQDGVAKGHKNASQIMHWKDGRPNIEDVCPS